MRKFAFAVMALGFMVVSAQPADAQMSMQDSEEVEFEAQVVDLSCKVVYDLSGEGHRECSQVCADRGVPLGLVDSEGNFYLPVTSDMPGADQNGTLRAHAEHTVKVKGKVFERAGMNAIIIESVSM